MPPVDLETLIRGGAGCVGGGGGDGKVVCETLIDSQRAEVAPPPPPDFPAESFRLPIEEELEWFDRNAFYERKQSTRRGNAAGFGPSGAIHPSFSSNSTSQRISGKSKAQIFGLPKLPDSGQLRRTLRRSVRRPSIRFFPRQQSGKRALTEPSSPKVSCIGRVRSKRDTRRRRGKRRDGGGSGRGEIKSSKSAAADEEIKKPSIWRSIRSMLRLSGGRRRRERRSDASERRSPAATDSSPDLGQEKSLSAPVTIPAAGAVPPSLGDLRRFSSGRRSASWGGIGFEVEVETDAGGASSVSRREPSKTREVWERRAAAQPLEAIRCDRDLDSVGPATV
ncbi:hypothetical protein H6P81_003643 [Aristolochia fimbriata]|uniref:Uncharacterized protein n=1 Tax=Aristolochia fimbriata TaxID=158543 RepID=A0AAV7FD77_ARIFI|nr:hypothetical protein H6P81_003643 [Aristolochia fimbriata]